MSSINIISLTPSENGAYNGLQTWNETAIPTGYAQWPDDLETDTFYEYNGFVTLTVKRNFVTEYTPNIVAWEEWKATLPPTPEPEPEPQPGGSSDADAILNVLLGVTE